MLKYIDIATALLNSTRMEQIFIHLTFDEQLLVLKLIVDTMDSDGFVINDMVYDNVQNLLLKHVMDNCLRASFMMMLSQANSNLSKKFHNGKDKWSWYQRKEMLELAKAQIHYEWEEIDIRERWRFHLLVNIKYPITVGELKDILKQLKEPVPKEFLEKIKQGA